MAVTRGFFFDSQRANRNTVPRLGPINGSQKRTTTWSGFSRASNHPTRNQLKGFTELIKVRICKPGGAVSSVNWVLPGNKNPGYCREKEKITTSWPAACKASARRSEEAAMPPRSGCAGEIKTIFVDDTSADLRRNYGIPTEETDEALLTIVSGFPTPARGIAGRLEVQHHPLAGWYWCMPQDAAWQSKKNGEPVKNFVPPIFVPVPAMAFWS